MLASLFQLKYTVLSQSPEATKRKKRHSMTFDASSIADDQQLQSFSVNHNMSSHVTVGTVAAKPAPHTGSYSRLHVSNPKGKHMSDDYMNELNKQGTQPA